MNDCGASGISTVASTLLVLMGSFVAFGIWLVDKQASTTKFAIPLFSLASATVGCLALVIAFDVAGLVLQALLVLLVGLSLLFVLFSGVAWTVIILVPWNRGAEEKPPKLWIPPRARGRGGGESESQHN